MLSLCLVQFVDVLGVTVVVTALPAMLASLLMSATASSAVALMAGRCLQGAAAAGSVPSPGARTPAPTVAWAVAATVAAVGAGCFAIAGRRSSTPEPSEGSQPRKATDSWLGRQPVD